MTDTLPLDPEPVRWRRGTQRTAQLGLLRARPDAYVFEPRPGFNPDRSTYRTRVIITRVTVIDDAAPEHVEVTS